MAERKLEFEGTQLKREPEPEPETDTMTQEPRASKELIESAKSEYQERLQSKKESREGAERLEAEETAAAKEAERNLSITERIRGRGKALATAAAKGIYSKIASTSTRATEELRGVHKTAWHGVKRGWKEANQSTENKIFHAGRSIGRSPITAYESAKRIQASGRTSLFTPKPKSMRGLAGMGGGVSTHKPFTPKPTGGMGLIGRSAGSIQSGGRVIAGGYGKYPIGKSAIHTIPRNVIKSYWSNKIKSAARSAIRRFGVEEGLAKTRKVAAEMNWKMQ